MTLSLDEMEAILTTLGIDWLYRANYDDWSLISLYLNIEDEGPIGEIANQLGYYPTKEEAFEAFMSGIRKHKEQTG